MALFGDRGGRKHSTAAAILCLGKVPTSRVQETVIPILHDNADLKCIVSRVIDINV